MKKVGTFLSVLSAIAAIIIAVISLSSKKEMINHSASSALKEQFPAESVDDCDSTPEDDPLFCQGATKADCTIDNPKMYQCAVCINSSAPEIIGDGVDNNCDGHIEEVYCWDAGTGKQHLPTCHYHAEANEYTCWSPEIWNTRDPIPKCECWSFSDKPIPTFYPEKTTCCIADVDEKPFTCKSAVFSLPH